MGKHSRPTQPKLDQSGLVSIIVTTIIMVILGLIVVGFARIARREQRQALDRQLNTQAYYAAESGVNDAIEVLNSGTFDPDIDYSSDCNRFISDHSLKSNIDGATTSYSCLLIDSSPNTLEFGNIGNNSRVIPIENTVATPRPRFARLDISWQDTSASADFSNCTVDRNAWPTSGAWACRTGVIRADLVRTDGNFQIGELNNTMLTAFFTPQNSRSDGGLTFGSNQGYANAGTVWYVRCVTSAPTPAQPKHCTASITGLGNGESYMLRLRSLYRESAVTVLAYDSSNNRIDLTGVQAQVDSTGKANDILRRIQVRVPLANPSGPFPDFAVQSIFDICKRLTVLPNSVTGQAAPANCNPLN